MLLVAVALCLAYRFCRDLRPIAEGVSYLAVKKPVKLQERGILKELAEKLNQTSALLLRQDAKLAQRGCLVQISFMKSASDREMVQCVFTDTGDGIPEEVVRALLGTAESEVHVMGLRVVQQIVEAHGWRFELVRRERGGYDAVMRISIS